MTNQEFLATCGLFARDRSNLLDLPLKYRWEFTRRHPYYLLLWGAARGYCRNEFAPGTAEMENGWVAMNLLGLIGVTGEPVDPVNNFEQLGDLDPAFLSGSIQPMTLRAMIVTLIQALPRTEIEMLRAVLDAVVNPDFAVLGESDLSVQKHQALGQLARLSSARLDSYPDAPLYYIHMDASQRRIVEDVEVFVRRWKKRRNISERRTRITEFPEYLKIWDLREGWKDGSYRVEDERSFGQVAKELGQSKSTVVNAYGAAFNRIIGQEFATELWIRVMGLIKLPALNSQPGTRLRARYRRLMSSNAPTPAPESRVERQPTEHGNVGLIERESTIEGDQASVELQMDILELINRGFSDLQIAKELELDNQEVEVIGYFRSRVAEMDDFR